LTRRGKTCQRRSGVDDDSGELEAAEHAPCDAESLDADDRTRLGDPQTEAEVALAIPRTITTEEPHTPDEGNAGDDDDDVDDDANARARRAVQRHLVCLRATALRLTHNQPDADELVQDTVERALKKGVAANVRRSKSWLCRMMLNLFLDRCRSEARRVHHEPIDGQLLEDLYNVTPLPLDDPEPDWQRVTIDDVRQALDEITVPFREVYILHEFEHWSYAQIAAHLKISTVTVGTRLSRVRERLRGILKKLIDKKPDGGRGEE